MTEEKTENQAGAASAEDAKAATLPLKPAAPQAVRPVSTPVRASVSRPEIVRRPRDYSSSARDDRSVGSGGYGSDGKKLIVGREIALSGAISSCEKLVVEGRVEADMSECHEIEIAESGTFKGAAEIEVAEISGLFEGSITARDLLIVRSTGRVTGTIRYGRLEIERGGEIEGDVEVLSADKAAASGANAG